MTTPEISGFGELTEIGRGGYSRVYQAREFEFDRLVAVKVLNDPIKDGSSAAAFERECRTMGRLLHHPNIVTVIKSVFTSEDRPCIVMELFHEGSYHQRLRRTGSIEIAELLRLGVKVAGALSTAHAAGVLHGDVKPHNIFRSKFGEPALGDFGIATFVRGREGGLPRGFSVHYAAPDLIDGTPSASSDQYSLAATLFTLALGRRPFESSDPTTGNTSEQVLLRALKEPVPRLPNRFPDALTEALWRAMSKDPDYRFGELTEFTAELNEAEAALDLPVTEMPLDSEVVRDARPSTAARRVSLLHDSTGSRIEPSADESDDHLATKVFVEPGAASDGSGPGSGAGLDDATRISGDHSLDMYSSMRIPAGRAVLSGGRSELLDADLVIGRNPASQSLGAHQRAVVHGQDDRTVSRRQLELRVRASEVSVVSLGSRIALVAGDGTTSDLIAGDTRALEFGDTLFYGIDSWLRFEPADVAAASQSDQARADSSVREGLHEPSDVEGDAVDRTTQNLSLAQQRRVDDARLAEPVASGPAVASDVVFSDGRVEPLDVDLVIGRNPRSEPLQAHQRAVFHGEGDRTISRRHIELRPRGGRVIAVVLGRGAVIQATDGAIQELEGNTECQLRVGDVLHYGRDGWLRLGGTDTI